ncbi:MAG TPA: lipid-binding SYLF domain-containing protein [Panacibacter sp.]|nr:lipid-binding SYLF domain-containing protein [Panacibacter sp.]HNP46839.1 lipid-binding SYLF domain-containing protein [Panacibacter sp.]
MKKSPVMFFAVMVLVVCSSVMPTLLQAQDSKETMMAESKEAKSAFIKTDESMNGLFKDAYGYVVFPNIGKGALVVGGAGGKGIVYEQGKATGPAKMVQVTVGAQAGGQSYREVIFFQTKEALERFKNNNLEFSGQVSAVAAKSGASANAKYTDGVLVFTQERGGLMVEASIGGQKFTYEPF